jgi:phage head maturation protease
MDEAAFHAALRAAGMLTNPKGTERLHEYWVHGPGAAKIRWGEPNDFSRCVEHLGKFIKDPQGYCNLAHHAALGFYPATHAAMEHGRAAMADSKKPYGDVTYADPKNGKYPIDTEAHARAAWAYINMPKNAAAYPLNGVTLSEVKDRIMAACKKFGIDVSDGDSPGDSPGRADSAAPMWRPFPISDISVRSGRKGKIVTAYCAVFNTPAEIHDHDGDYSEELDPVVFNKAISDARPQGTRANWRCGVFYNHGMTILGTPSDRHSIPLGIPMDVSTDQVGVRTDSEFHNSEFAQEIIEGLESGAIPGFSFSGRFLRSTPRIPRGGFQRRRDGSLPTVRRMESTLREYGPTPFPAYKEAAVIGVRAESLLGAMAADPELAMRMLSMFRDGTPPHEEPPSPSGTPPHEEPPPRSRPVHSGRSIREQVQRNTALLLQGQYRR